MDLWSCTATATLAYDAAVVAGIGWKDGRPVTVIAIERGTTTKERMRPQLWYGTS